MKSIARHTIDQELATEGVGREGAAMDSLVESARTRPQALSMLLSTARGYAGYLSTVSNANDRMCSALKAGARAAEALFAEPAATDATHPGNWRIGWWLAQLVRSRQTINRLAATPIDLLRKSSSQTDECQYLFVSALQAYQARTDDWSTRLQRAVDATDAATLKLSDPEFVLDLLVPEMELFYRFTTGAIAEFNETLQFALERHKKYWGRPNRQRDPKGFLALGLLAIASLARQAGFVIEVQSDYLPSFLLEGQCTE